MRIAVKSFLFIWATVSVASLCALVYVFPGYSIDSTFSEALRKRPSPQGSFWFHWAMTFWLYRVHRKHCGPM